MSRITAPINSIVIKCTLQVGLGSELGPFKGSDQIGGTETLYLGESL